MIVTINTDASYCSRNRIGAYAFWIVCNQGKIARSGILKSNNIHRSEVAEFQCIINSLSCVMSAKIEGIHKIIINTDCLNVIHLANGDKAAIRKYNLQWGKHLAHKMRVLLSSGILKKVTIEFRHVMAHQSTSTSRQWVNDWCDTEAKKHLRIARELKKQKDLNL